MTIAVILVGAFAMNYLLNLIYQRFWKKHLDVCVEFQKEPALEGKDAYLTETITNQKWLFLPVLQVGFQMHRNLWFADGENASVSDHCYKRDIFSVGSYQKITRTIPFHCTKRGYYELKNVELVTRTPLMTRKLYETLSRPDFFYVYPGLVEEHLLDFAFQKVMGSVLTRKNLYEDPFEFRGIREYCVTDPMSRINWKASARTDQWMVNLYDSTAAQEVVLLLDVEDETVWKYHKLHEEGIRLAASMAARCVQNSIPVGIRTNGRDVLTKEPFHLTVGTGKQHVRSVNEGLARLDLLQEPEKMEVILKKEREQIEQVQRTYVMITKRQTGACYDAFCRLISQGGSGIWICTLHEDMEWRMVDQAICPVIRWEVEK